MRGLAQLQIDRHVGSAPGIHRDAGVNPGLKTSRSDGELVGTDLKARKDKGAIGRTDCGLNKPGRLVFQPDRIEAQIRPAREVSFGVKVAVADASKAT